jgi:fatty-acid desaturase
MKPKFYFTHLRWYVLISLLSIHLVTLAARATYSWQGLVCFLVLYQLTGLGVTAGYHRLLTHNSYKTCRPVLWFLTLAGMASGQGAPAEWVAFHRKHHEFSDEPDDPHSPHHGGFFWAHMAWLWHPFSSGERTGLYKRYAKDALEDPFLRYVSKPRVYLAWVLFTWVCIAGVGLALGGWDMCLSFLVYGVFLRLVAMYHVTWFVNSATHVWGYRIHETSDKSRNLWWVALLTNGEGWHNGHHGYQTAANHGQRWWELDITYELIRLFAICRLASNVSTFNLSTGKVEIRYKR